MTLERITIEAAIKILLLIGGVMTAAAYLVLVERWIAAWVQMRKGPNRVGVPFTKIRLFGLGQPLADGLKFIFKEEYTPAHVNWRLYVLAPILILATALAVYSVIPFGSVVPPAPQWIPDAVQWQEPIPLVVAPGMDVGIIFVFALTSLAVYGVILGGWASDNKYSFLGGLRSSAQLISYELSLGLGILGVVLAAGSLRLDAMIDAQAQSGWWNVFTQPLGFMVFLTAAFAESARLPFDLPEAEQELIGGYHTEYSGIKLLLFLVGEFIHMITASVLIVILFFGGWHIWGMSPPGEVIGWGEAILRIVVLNMKVLVVILFFMLVRWTFPRFRFDQLMALGWKVMLPLGILNLVSVAVLEEWYVRRPDQTQLAYLAIGWSVFIAGWSAVAWASPRLSDNAPRPLET